MGVFIRGNELARDLHHLPPGILPLIASGREARASSPPGRFAGARDRMAELRAGGVSGAGARESLCGPPIARWTGCCLLRSSEVTALGVTGTVNRRLVRLAFTVHLESPGAESGSKHRTVIVFDSALNSKRSRRMIFLA